MTKEVIKEISLLLDKYCEDCEVKKTIRKAHGEHNAQIYCADICKTGIKLKKLGQKLEPETRIARKLDSTYYQTLKLQGLTDAEIAKKFGMGHTTLSRRKKIWGVHYPQVTEKFNQHSKLEYLRLKEQGYSDAGVARAWRIGNSTIRRWKHAWGLMQ